MVGVALCDTTDEVTDHDAVLVLVAVLVAVAVLIAVVELVAVTVLVPVCELGAVLLAVGEMPQEDVAVAVAVDVAVNDTDADGTARQAGSDARMMVPLLQAVPLGTACKPVATPLEHWTKKDEHGDSGRRSKYCARRNAASAPVHAQ